MTNKPTPVSSDEKRWRAENDCRTLTDADSVRRDPSRHRAARGHARRQMVSYRRVAGGKR